MLFHLLYPLHGQVSALNVVQYITFRTAAATLTALFISFLVGPWRSRQLAVLLYQLQNYIFQQHKLYCVLYFHSLL